MNSKISSEPLSLVVLAAGIGSRYGGLKQIDSIGPHDETILDYSIYDALQAGFNHVVFVINQQIDTIFRERIGRRISRHCTTSYAYQELDRLPSGYTPPPGRTKPWGTAHATLMAQELIDAPFAVINADDFYGRTAYQLVAKHLDAQRHKKVNHDYCLVGFELGNTLSQHGYVSRGICQVNESGFLTSVVERTRIQPTNNGVGFSEDNGQTWHSLSETTPVSMNMWGFTPAIFAPLRSGFQSFLEEQGRDTMLREYYLPAIVNKMIKQDQAKFRLLSTPDSWFGVTYQQDISWVRASIANLIELGKYPSDLWTHG